MKKLIEKIIAETNYQNNPYFLSLNDGSFLKDDFIETQIQFYFAVVFFPRPMAVAAAKIPTHKKRLEIIQNVWEEHGSGVSGAFHSNTFIKFLELLSKNSTQAIVKRKLWPEVRAFNTALIGACVVDEYIVSIAVLGVIERMFSQISTWIGKGIVKRGWINADCMMHYNLHEELDVKHSQDFFDVLQEPWESSKENQYLIEQGFALGAYCFNQLFQGLYNSRKTRNISDVDIVRHQRS